MTMTTIRATETDAPERIVTEPLLKGRRRILMQTWPHPGPTEAFLSYEVHESADGTFEARCSHTDIVRGVPAEPRHMVTLCGTTSRGEAALRGREWIFCTN